MLVIPTFETVEQTVFKNKKDKKICYWPYGLYGSTDEVFMFS